MEDYQSFPLTAVTLLDRSLTFLTNHRINLVSIFKFSSSIDRSFARDEIYIYVFLQGLRVSRLGRVRRRASFAYL